MPENKDDMPAIDIYEEVDWLKPDDEYHAKTTGSSTNNENNANAIEDSNANTDEIINEENADMPSEGDEEMPYEFEEAEEIIPDPVDAAVTIIPTPDGLHASIFVSSPQYGGKDIDMDMVKEAIELSRITVGIDESVLKTLVDNHAYDSEVIFANGIAAERGKDGVITSHFEQTKKLVPKLLENDIVDFRDLGLVVNIRRGTPICSIKYNTEGTPGMDIYGNEITPPPSKMPDIPMGLNTGLNGDESKLLALESGNLIYVNGRFTVETTFTIKSDIDLSTGNIEFIGDIVIQGGIAEGFTINSGKSITIHNLVEGATLIAGENIVCKNGVINSTVQAKGSVTIGFAENTKITCKGNLKSGSLIVCDVNTEGEIDCTAKPGTIMGGQYVTAGNITANTIGYKSYISTTITCGGFAILVEEKISLEEKIIQIDESITKLETAVTYLKELKKTEGKLSAEREQFLSNAVKQKVHLNLEKAPILARIKEIDGYMKNADNLVISVKRALYPNVFINLDRFNYKVQDEYGKCKIMVMDGDLKIV